MGSGGASETALGGLRSALDPARIPNHVAIIMDGNGRWANQRGLPRNAGHEAGERSLFDTVEGAADLGIRNLTVYAFSTENWRRPPSEVRFLLGFNESLLVRRSAELHERNVRVRFVGSRGRPVPRRLVQLMEDTEALTRENTMMTLRIAFNYGSKAEITDAARRAAEDYAAGRLRVVNDAAIAARLHDPEMPSVDLLVRTSGEQRLSNYLLWQAAYAELVFVDTHWPDFDRHELARCVALYQARDRRFGGAVDTPLTAGENPQTSTLEGTLPVAGDATTPSVEDATADGLHNGTPLSGRRDRPARDERNRGVR